MSREFFNDIVKFNNLYRLENHDTPTLISHQRIHHFHEILSEELREGLEIAQKYALWEQNNSLTSEQASEILTEMADWLGDLIVYCASEGQRWGLPLPQILEIIMSSNFSKLDSEGRPIYDHRGKVMKGPNYWKPEGKIKELIVQTQTKDVVHES